MMGLTFSSFGTISSGDLRAANQSGMLISYCIPAEVASRHCLNSLPADALVSASSLRQQTIPSPHRPLLIRLAFFSSVGTACPATGLRPRSTTRCHGGVGPVSELAGRGCCVGVSSPRQSSFGREWSSAPDSAQVPLSHALRRRGCTTTENNPSGREQVLSSHWGGMERSEVSEPGVQPATTAVGAWTLKFHNFDRWPGQSLIACCFHTEGSLVAWLRR